MPMLVRHARDKLNSFYIGETFWALLLATLTNVAIVVAVAHNAAGNSFSSAFARIRLHAGNSDALLFGAALAVLGLAASLTATSSGDYVVSAFSSVRISPFLRRAATATPACALMSLGFDPLKLVIGSQVLLAVVLPAVAIPLVMLMMSKEPGVSRFSKRRLISSGVAAVLCIGFDFVLLSIFFRI